MTKSRTVEVNVTQSTLVGQTAQVTADSAASQAGTADSAALIAQSTADAAKEAANSTYAYANSEISVQSTATAKAQSTADNAFSQAQAVGSQASAEISSNSTATAKAQSTADNAFSQATTAIDNGKVTSQAVTDLKDGSKLTIADLENGLATKVANSEYASYKVQTASQIAQKVDNGAFSAYKTQTADLIAQKVANSDFSAYQATTAKSIESKVESSDFNTYKTQTANLIDDKVSSSEYASDKTQTASEIADRVSNSAFSTYQTQTASQIAQKVDNGAFSAYQSTTADLIASKVATKDFSAYQATTAKAISSKVESKDFNTYKEETAGMISSKVSNGDFATYKTQTANDINLRVATKDLIDQINLQAGNTLISSSGQLTLAADTIYFDTKNPVIIPSANIDKLLTRKKITAADISASTFSTNNGTFTVDKSGAVVASNLTIRGVTNLVYNAALLGGNGSKIPGWSINHDAYCALNMTHDGVPSIGWNNTTGAGDWNNFAQSKLVPLNGVTGQPFSASVWFKEYGSDTSLHYKFILAFFDSNGNRLNYNDGGFDGKAIPGISSEQDWRYVTIDNVVAPSNAVSVGLQYLAYNGTGHAAFSSPMLTQTAQSTGYQPDTGNVVSAGEINGSVINGSTINGTTFNAGDISTDANNTNKVYPFHISDGGNATATAFDTMDVMQSAMVPGGLRLKYRATSSSDTKYGAYDVTLEADQLVLNSGYTTGKDTTFSQSVSGTQLTGQVVVSPLDGLRLYGDTQTIHFNGMSTDTTPKGIAFTPYGNINATGTQGTWYLGHDNNLQTANFGIDSAGSNLINFYRPLFVDEIGALTSSNGHALFIHGDDNGKSGSTGQMLFKKDGRSAQVVSASIYNRTYSGGSNVTVTSYGTLGRITSASKYKLDITKETSISPANKLLSIDMSSWIDKSSAELLADSKTNGTELSEPEINVNRHYGLIAEDLIKAGLDEFVIKGDKGQAEGIEYDRLWTVLIPKIRQLSNNQIQNKMTIAKLESEIEELKQGR